MLKAIPRYGARVVVNTDQIITECRQKGQLVQGPEVEEFEATFARRLGSGEAVSASYGRMAFWYILQALDLPAGSEVILPALTFWVIPELVRASGLRPVFADVNPQTFNLDAASVQPLISSRTRALVPTHLYGQPCDMDPLLELAARHNLHVIEDCAHALGACYRGRPVGTLGDAALFSFQSLKPLNTYGGGMAVIQNKELAGRVAQLARQEPWPAEDEVERRLKFARLQERFMRASVFTYSGFPILWLSSWLNLKPDVWLWEKIRPLYPLPPQYRKRYSNVQAALGLAGLAELDEWTTRVRTHARVLANSLKDVPGVVTPEVSPSGSHVFYQYSVYVPDREKFVTGCIRRGLDVETLHVDVCPRVSLFKEFSQPCAGADRTAEAVQLPVYASLSDEQVRRVAKVAREVLAGCRNV